MPTLATCGFMPAAEHLSTKVQSELMVQPERQVLPVSAEQQVLAALPDQQDLLVQPERKVQVVQQV